MVNQFLTSMNTDFFCTASRISRDLPHQIWEAQTADGIVNPLITRFFHNKLFFYLNNYLRCYLSYLSLDYIANVITFAGMVLYVFGIWHLVSRKSKWIVVILLTPLFPLLEWPRLAGWRVGLYYFGLISMTACGFYALWDWWGRKLFRRITK